MKKKKVLQHLPKNLQWLAEYYFVDPSKQNKIRTEELREYRKKGRIQRYEKKRQSGEWENENDLGLSIARLEDDKYSEYNQARDQFKRDVLANAIMLAENDAKPEEQSVIDERFRKQIQVQNSILDSIDKIGTPNEKSVAKVQYPRSVCGRCKKGEIGNYDCINCRPQLKKEDYTLRDDKNNEVERFMLDIAIPDQINYIEVVNKPGKIIGVNKDTTPFTYDIEFDTGETEKNMSKGEIVTSLEGSFELLEGVRIKGTKKLISISNKTNKADALGKLMEWYQGFKDQKWIKQNLSDLQNDPTALLWTMMVEPDEDTVDYVRKSVEEANMKFIRTPKGKRIAKPGLKSSVTDASSAEKVAERSRLFSKQKERYKNKKSRFDEKFTPMESKPPLLPSREVDPSSDNEQKLGDDKYFKSFYRDNLSEDDPAKQALIIADRITREKMAKEQTKKEETTKEETTKEQTTKGGKYSNKFGKNTRKGKRSTKKKSKANKKTRKGKRKGSINKKTRQVSRRKFTTKR